MLQSVFLRLLCCFKLLLWGINSVHVLFLAEGLLFAGILKVPSLVFISIAQTEDSGPVITHLLLPLLFFQRQSMHLDV